MVDAGLYQYINASSWPSLDNNSRQRNYLRLLRKGVLPFLKLHKGTRVKRKSYSSEPTASLRVPDSLLLWESAVCMQQHLHPEPCAADDFCVRRGLAAGRS